VKRRRSVAFKSNLANPKLDVRISEVTVNPEAVEPNEYFGVLKDSVKSANADDLQKQLCVVAEHLIRAKKVGQKNLLNVAFRIIWRNVSELFGVKSWHAKAQRSVRSSS
jgi:hypothetical protein